MNDERARRLALNEALIRDVNEAVGDLAEGWFDRDERVEFRCECVRPDCDATIALTMAEYTDVRSVPTQFAVAPGHAEPSVERIVRENERMHVVDKVGVGRAVAEETDRRSSGQGS